MNKKIWLLALVGAVLWGQAAWAQDFYVIAGGGAVGTKISSVPYTISNPGFYYLSGNLTAASGNGITVNADNVTIDLMGFSLSGNSGDSYGIYMSGRKNVEIRNGTLTGWTTGIAEISASSSGHRIINIRTDGCQQGIYLSGDGVVKGCTATGPANNLGLQGILINGTGMVSGCTATNFPSSSAIALGSGVCHDNVAINGYIGIFIGKSGSVIGNTVTTNSLQTGIYLAGSPSDYVMLDQNTVAGTGLAILTPQSAANVRGTNAGF